MLREPPLRQSAGWSGLGAAVLGLVTLSWPPLAHLPQTLVALGLVAAGTALWCEVRRPFPRSACLAATLALCLGLASLGSLAFSGRLSPAQLALREPAPQATELAAADLPHAALALLLAAGALLALICLRHRRISAVLSCGVIATACTALLLNSLRTVVTFARPLQIPPGTALALLALGAGTLLARPEEKLLQIILARTAAGKLARRLLSSITLLPSALIGLVVLAMQFRLIEQRYGVALLALVILFAGLVVALYAAEFALDLDSDREAMEGSRLLLTARLQEQAAQLQETVGQRTRELREANEHLRQVADANARLALVARHTTDGVVITDAAGLVEWVNTAFENHTGFTLAEIRGQKPGKFLQGPETDRATVAQLREAVHTGAACRAEILNYTKDRRPYWQSLDIQPVRDAAGTLINFIGVQSDITRQREAGAQLRMLTERLTLATHVAALGVWEWDPVSRQSRWDARQLEIYGVTAAQFRGRSIDWRERLHPADRDAAIAAVQALVTSDGELDHTFRIVRLTDGATRHLRCRAIAQRDTIGRLLRIVGTERDITDEIESVRQTEALNERLRLALRASNYGVWEVDVATERLQWDDRMLELHGMHREEFDESRDTWRRCLHPDDRLLAENAAQAVLRGESPVYESEFRIVRPDGTVRHIEANGYLHRDATGHPLRLVGLNRDITAEKQLQQALDLAEQRWQLALESTNDGVWDWDIQAGTFFHDERSLRMLGFAPGEIPADSEGWRHLVHPGDLADYDATGRAHIEGQTPYYRHEHRLKTKTGEWKWILDRGKVVARAPDGRPLRMVGTHTDITPRKELEERLRRTEALGEQVSRIALIGGWELNLETKEIICTEGTLHIHELEVDCKPTLELARTFFPPEAQDILRASMYSRTPEDPTFDHELRFVTAKGRRLWVHVIGRATFRDGRPVTVQGAMQDVTARRESDEARRTLEGQLFHAQKMETLGTLAGGIAHDFNNLLTGIIGYHELAADSLAEDHPARACLAEARGASLRARALVEQILTFGRQPAGSGHAPLDLGSVIEEARRFLRSTLPANISIDLEIAPDTPLVLGDATQLHQVILNLGSNAGHAMRQHGGTLTVRIEPAAMTAELANSVSGPTNGSYVRLTVTDTGHGMDETTRRRIFDPFFTTKNTREGTGLGLAVVHGIVRAHRGAIDVESAPGMGTTFHIFLPAAVEETAAPRESTGPAPRGAGEFVCVVDDEEIVGSCTKLVLESRGYRTVVFASAEECFAAIQETAGACALLVTDQTMPGMQGTELVAALRQTNPRLPAVIMSGYFSKIAPHILSELGQVELLAKPFTTEELTQAVHRALHPELIDL